MKRALVFIVCILSFANCANQKDQNKVDLKVLLSNGDVIFINGEVDSEKISSCGVAVPGTTGTSTGTTGGTTGTPTTGGGSTSTRYTVTSQLIMKDTGESLVLRF